MLLRTDGGLQTVWVVGPQHLADGGKELAAVLCNTDIVFLIYRLQLSMETADDHILETVSLNLRPVLYLVAGDVFRVARHIVRGIGIRSLCTDSSHQLVVFIGNEILGSNL